MKTILKFLSIFLAVVALFCVMFAMSLADPAEVRPAAAISLVASVFSLALNFYTEDDE